MKRLNIKAGNSSLSNTTSVVDLLSIFVNFSTLSVIKEFEYFYNLLNFIFWAFSSSQPQFYININSIVAYWLKRFFEIQEHNFLLRFLFLLTPIHKFLIIDVIHFKKNHEVYKKMVIEGFRRVGDEMWPNHVGIFTIPVMFVFKILYCLFFKFLKFFKNLLFPRHHLLFLRLSL